MPLITFNNSRVNLSVRILYWFSIPSSTQGATIHSVFFFNLSTSPSSIFLSSVYVLNCVDVFSRGQMVSARAHTQNKLDADSNGILDKMETQSCSPRFINDDQNFWVNLDLVLTCYEFLALSRYDSWQSAPKTKKLDHLAKKFSMTFLSSSNFPCPARALWCPRKFITWLG